MESGRNFFFIASHVLCRGADYKAVQLFMLMLVPQTLTQFAANYIIIIIIHAEHTAALLKEGAAIAADHINQHRHIHRGGANWFAALAGQWLAIRRRATSSTSTDQPTHKLNHR